MSIEDPSPEPFTVGTVDQFVHHFLSHLGPARLRERALDVADGGHSTLDLDLLALVERSYLRAVGEYAEWLAGMDDGSSLPGRAWGVYELLDDQGVAFYVGMSGIPRARVRSHRSEFGDLISDVRWTSTPDRASALRLERQMIHDLNPRMNIQGVPR